ncbi:MAG TPA: hypothetical protein VMR31_05125 [Myxococcota bacterium]|nr:hypothetical protein [Myxococcota bacterium]
MRRGVVIAFAILGLSACGQKESGSSGPMDAPTPSSGGGAAPAESAAPAPATPPVGAADSGAANPDSASCLDLVAVGSFEKAVPVCTAAVANEPANDQLKSALETAKSKVAEMAGSAGGAAAGAASEAEDAAGKAKDAMPSKPY